MYGASIEPYQESGLSCEHRAVNVDVDEILKWSRNDIEAELIDVVDLVELMNRIIGTLTKKISSLRNTPFKRLMQLILRLKIMSQRNTMMISQMKMWTPKMNLLIFTP